jgi:hypothetical protein
MRNAIIAGCSAIASGIAGWIVPLKFPNLDPLVADGLLLIAAALMIIAITLWLSGLSAERAGQPDASAVTTTGTAVVSHGQTGGITAGTVHFSPPQRDLASDQFANLRRQLVELDREGGEWSIGASFSDPEAAEFARQICKFLRENGFDAVQAILPGFFAPGVSADIANRTITVGKAT